MVAISVDYLGELHCKATHLPSGSIIETDAPVDNKGKGEKFSPTDLVAAAVGTCIATVLGLYAQSKDLNLTGMRLEIQKEMTKVPPRRISILEIQVKVPIELNAFDKAKFEEIAYTCPVTASLHPDVFLRVTFHWK